MYLFLNYSVYIGMNKENILETLWILTCLLLNPRPQTIHMCLGACMENAVEGGEVDSGHLFSPSQEEVSLLSQREAGLPSGKFPITNLVPKSSNRLVVRNGLGGGVRKRERERVYCHNRLPLSCHFSPQKGGTVANRPWRPASDIWAHCYLAIPLPSSFTLCVGSISSLSPTNIYTSCVPLQIGLISAYFWNRDIPVQP